MSLTGLVNNPICQESEMSGHDFNYLVTMENIYEEGT